MNNVKKVLLIEPFYANKYPPLGLMKIATAHKLFGDEIYFHRGTSAALRDGHWDTLYIGTLFTFQWRGVVETIHFYAKSKKKIVIGGILASLLPKEIEKSTGIKPHIGPFKGDINQIKNVILSDEDLVQLSSEISTDGIDFLPPDYGIFNGLSVPYQKVLDECYILRTTKGCSRGCSFCAVKYLEPNLVQRIPVKPYISYIEKRWGEKRNLLLLDDNVLLSSRFNEIIDEIRDLGFEKGAKLNRKQRSVDFNQGLDIRLLKKKDIKKLSTIAIRPLRLAFDNCSLKEIYQKKIEWALDAGITEISIYLLYNYEDSPKDLYNRLKTSCELNEKYGWRIYSFPMKYIPCNSKDRKFIGSKWTRRQIRGVQCILNATHGIAPTNPKFFRLAFGENLKEFLQILQLPENYIIERTKYARNGVMQEWKDSYHSMSSYERRLVRQLIAGGKGSFNGYSNNLRIYQFLKHYRNENISSKQIIQ